MTVDVDLGFPEAIDPLQSHRVTSKYFPSKVGGRPAWLSFDDLPDSEKLRCSSCSRQLTFLLQLYAPLEDDPQAFHRSVFVFVCNTDNCEQPSCRVFRCQLQRSNKFYSFDPPDYDRADQDTDLVGASKFGVTTCRVCGCVADKKCGSCRKVWYCSKDHQTLDWKAGHKGSCKGEAVDGDEASKFLFKEYEVVIEPEEDNEDAASDDEGEGDMAAFQEALRRLKPKCQDENVDKYVDDQEDASFSRFSGVIRKNKEQVVRYYKYDKKSEQATPLWATDANQLTSEPPKCDNCDSERVLEFQVMPQVINILGECHLDWATLTVYTCKANCVNDKCDYLQEFVWMQKY